ncbi:ASCH domain-containing protein [Candidatus Woesearchaeota archaeon]|nr:ASCH domain-containing protein [Candidatus Woesearchaeota archaeon]
MRKSWDLTQKILTGQKKIESRWYKVKYAPWNRIKSGDVVYFKDSGEPVTIKTEVDKVIQFSDLNPEKVREILYQYGQADGLGIDTIPEFFEMFKDKKYCMLIFLKNPQKIIPFEIDKSGFGAMSAWISIDDINRIKVNS